MAKIQINTQYRLASDEHQWMVQKFKGVAKSGRREGEEVWESISFHRELGEAATALAKREVRCSDVDGIASVQQEWERITGEIDTAFRSWRPPSTSQVQSDGQQYVTVELKPGELSGG